MTFVVKNKERPKFIRFEEGRTIKNEILPMSGQKESTTSIAMPATFNITQIRLNLLTAAFDGSRVTG